MANNKLMKKIVIGTLILIAIIVVAYLVYSFNTRNIITDSPAQIANPASVFCEEHGGKLEIRTNEQGGQYGVCIKNSKECEEWTYFRGECEL